MGASLEWCLSLNSSLRLTLRTLRLRGETSLELSYRRAAEFAESDAEEN
jgi:hypothetical protein